MELAKMEIKCRFEKIDVQRIDAARCMIHYTGRPSSCLIPRTLAARFISGMDVLGVRPGSAPLSGAKAIVYQDLFGETNYRSTTFTLGVQNLTNQPPPFYFPGGFDPATYDVIGRYFFVKASLRL